MNHTGPRAAPSPDLKPTPARARKEDNEIDKTAYNPPAPKGLGNSISRATTALALALAVVAAAFGLTFLLRGHLEDGTLVLLFLTTLALGASSLSFTRQLGDTYPLGEYFILSFAVALGLLADFRAWPKKGWSCFVQLP
ncbi:MAG: hypothetical protein HC821_02355 [Lewinella sp.]|nr:hypothetical protein [Lewinella sp.]